MITLEELLSEGPFLVRGKVTQRIFMVSAIRGTGGVIGIAPFNEGRPVPSKGEHIMLSAEHREQYFQKLDRIK